MTIQRASNIEDALTVDARAAALADTLDMCAYEDVRPRMIQIELMYGGERHHVPPALAAEIGRRLRLRPDYHKLCAWNGQDPAACRAAGYQPRAIAVETPSRIFGWLRGRRGDPHG